MRSPLPVPGRHLSFLELFFGILPHASTSHLATETRRQLICFLIVLIATLSPYVIQTYSQIPLLRETGSRH